jgi:hypothetical protein
MSCSHFAAASMSGMVSKAYPISGRSNIRGDERKGHDRPGQARCSGTTEALENGGSAHAAVKPAALIGAGMNEPPRRAR